MSANPLPSVITRRDIARLRILAELSAAGQLEFAALHHRLGRDPVFQGDVPLAPLLRALKKEGLISTTGGHPRRYCLRLVGRIELHALIQAASVELAQNISRGGPLAPSQHTAQRSPRPGSDIRRPAKPTSPQSALGSAHPPRAPPPITSRNSFTGSRGVVDFHASRGFHSKILMRFQGFGARLVLHDQPPDLRLSRPTDCRSGRTATCRLTS